MKHIGFACCAVAALLAATAAEAGRSYSPYDQQAVAKPEAAAPNSAVGCSGSTLAPGTQALGNNRAAGRAPETQTATAPCNGQGAAPDTPHEKSGGRRHSN
jgi:hypothetical protein